MSKQDWRGFSEFPWEDKSTEVVDLPGLSFTSTLLGDYVILDTRPTSHPKTESILRRLLAFLRRLLEKLLSCITCGCYSSSESEDVISKSAGNGKDITEDESHAVQSLMDFLESDDATREPVLTIPHHRCLQILSRSKHIELQKLAASAYLVYSHNTSVIYEDWQLEPLIYDLQNGPSLVQFQVVEALFHIVHNGADDNKKSVVLCGTIPMLMSLLKQAETNFQILILACLTSLMSDGLAQSTFSKTEYLDAVLHLVTSSNKHLRLGALGVLLNYSRNESSDLLPCSSAVQVLAEALDLSDKVTLEHSSAVICNLAIKVSFRKQVVAYKKGVILNRLIKLLLNHEEKIRFNACGALRNLACDSETQLLLVRIDCLPVLKALLVESHSQLLVTGLSLLKNIALHQQNEAKIIEETFLVQLERILRMKENPDAQEMAAMVLRNVSTIDTIDKILKAKCLEAYMDIILDEATTEDVLLAVTIATGIISEHLTTKYGLIQYHGGLSFPRLLYLAAKHSNMTVRETCAGIIAHISTIVMRPDFLQPHLNLLLYYFQGAISSNSVELLHIALWSLPKFLVHENFRHAFNERRLGEVVEIQVDFGMTEIIQNLARLTLDVAATGCIPDQ